jgi:hypothetical protein
MRATIAKPLGESDVREAAGIVIGVTFPHSSMSISSSGQAIFRTKTCFRADQKTGRSIPRESP